MTTYSHVVSDRENELMNKACAKATTPLASTIGAFMRECHANGFSMKLSAAGFSTFILMNLAKIVAMASRLPESEIDLHELDSIAASLQESLARQIDAMIQKANRKADENN